MPSEATREVVPTRGNTPGGQRSPGHWVANEPGPWEDMAGIAWSNLSSGGRSWWRTSRPEGKPTGRCTTRLPSPITWDASGLRGEEAGKPSARGVYAGQRLSFRTVGQAGSLINGVQSPGQNRTREIRPSGIVGRL